MENVTERKIGGVAGFLYAVIFFLVVYNPPIYAGLSFSVLAVILSLLILIENRNVAKDFLRKKPIKTLIRIFIVFFTYYIIEALIGFFVGGNENILSNLESNVVSYFSFFIVTIAIVVWAIKQKISFNGLSILYLKAGIIQTFIVIACLLSPAVKAFFNGLTAANSNSEKITRGLEFEAAYRNFGFASTLYDIFGFTMAILGVMAICQAFKGKKIYYVISFFLALSAAVNARSAFIIYVIGAFLMFMIPKGKITAFWFVRLTIVSTLAIVGISALFSWIVKGTNSEQLMWLASGIMETQSLSSGQSEGYYDILLHDFLIFPDGLGLIFGTGMPPHMAINHNSDVGYIQNLWSFGIIGSLLIYAFYIQLFRYAIHRLQWPDSIMLKTVMLMMIIYLVKLTCFGYSQASVVFGPLCFLAIYNGSTSHKKK